MTNATRWMLCGCLVVATPACARDGPSLSAVEASMAWRDSVLLEETDSVFIADAGGVAMLASGDIVVSDSRGARILRFGADGRFVSAVGSRGRGPGEFVAPSTVAVVGDSVVVVLDHATARLTQLSLANGRFVGAVRLEGNGFDLAVAGADVITSMLSLERGTVAARWASGADTLAAFGELPAVYGRFPRLKRQMADAVIAASATSVYVGTFAGPEVVSYAPDGQGMRRTHSVTIPRLIRRGVPLDSPAELLREMSAEDELAQLSVLVALAETSDGRIATLHLDYAFSEQAPSVIGYVSITDTEGRSRCTDLAVNLGVSVPVVARLINDTLVSLQQRVIGARSQTWLLKSPLPLTAC